MDFANMTVGELIEVRDGAASALKARREAAKATAKADAGARDAANRANDNLKEGAMVSFLFNKEIANGRVVRTSDKTVTVKSDAFKKGKGYRKYSEILEVLAPEEDAE